MSSTPKKRPKHKSRSSSSSPGPSLNSMAPPRYLLPSRKEFPRLIAVLAIASAVGLACNYLVTFFDPTSTPFCDSELISPDSLSDYCEPCPSNGICHQGKLECLQGYRKHGKFCVEDLDINDKAKKISKWVETCVCNAYANLLCYGTGTIWVQEDNIWKDLDGHDMMGNFGSGNEVSLYTKKRTMETVEKVFETRNNSYGMKELKCPDSLVEYYKPLPCHIHHWVLKHILVIASICLVFLGCIILLYKTRRRQKFSARVEELYCQVCDILEENALMPRSAHGESEPWIVASQLRDHLLLPKERKDTLMWKKVVELVQEDSRVDRYPKLVKGESKEVWEWQVEGSLSSSRRQKSMERGKSNLKESLNKNLHKPAHRPPMAG